MVVWVGVRGGGGVVSVADARGWFGGVGGSAVTCCWRKVTKVAANLGWAARSDFRRVVGSIGVVVVWVREGRRVGGDVGVIMGGGRPVVVGERVTLVVVRARWCP